MVATAENLLGVGIYSPAEAALYARVPTATLARWIFGNRQGDPVLHRQLVSSDEKIVTFLDFVQAMAIRVMRLTYKVPLETIRCAIETARDQYGVEHPLAKRHTTYLYGRKLVIRLPGQDQVVDVSPGETKHLLMLKEIVEIYMRDISWDAEGLAASYRAFSYAVDGNPIAVEMNPKLRFGEPLLPSCGYTAQALWEAAATEGGVEAAAKAYGVRPSEVEVACRYFDHIQVQTAA